MAGLMLLAQTRRRYLSWSYPRSASNSSGRRPGPIDTAMHRRYLVQERHQIGDIVVIAASQRHRRRSAVPISQDT
jgi:hypothetical protein